MSLPDKSCPNGDRLYLESGVSLRRIPTVTSSVSRSVSILVLASPIFRLISVNVVAPPSTACSINNTHFLPRRAKSHWACGQAH